MLNQLVEQILSLRDATSVEIPPHPESVDLRNYILEAIKPVCEHRGRSADLVTDFDLTSTHAKVDPELMCRIVTNLVSNATK